MRSIATAQRPLIHRTYRGEAEHDFKVLAHNANKKFVTCLARVNEAKRPGFTAHRVYDRLKFVALKQSLEEESDDSAYVRPKSQAKKPKPCNTYRNVATRKQVVNEHEKLFVRNLRVGKQEHHAVLGAIRVTFTTKSQPHNHQSYGVFLTPAFM